MNSTKKFPTMVAQGLHTVVAPLVHLNGTGKKELEGQLSDAINALDAARKTLAMARPHARDYYPLGDEAFELARSQAEAREQLIGKVIAELDEMSLMVMGFTR